MTASPVHDPTSGGGNVGSLATLGDLSGLASGPTFNMVDGGAYDPDKAYKVRRGAARGDAGRRGVVWRGAASKTYA